MNSGELDLKMRRNVSLAPVDAATEPGAPFSTGEAKVSLMKATDAHASGIVQVSRTARITEAFIVWIGCVKQAFALRFAQDSPAHATRAASPAISG